MKNKVIPRVNRDLIKNPDQYTLWLNALVERINRMNQTIELTDSNTDNVIVLGAQPDGTFGISKYHKQGDTYTLITAVV